MNTKEEALRVCRRLARGKNNDAVALLFEKCEKEELQKLDLFGVTELKHSDRGVEVKFADRLKAAQTLAQLGGEENVQPLFSALNLAAKEADGEEDAV